VKLEKLSAQWHEHVASFATTYISKVRGEPDAHAKCNHITQVPKSLQDRMEPEKAWEAHESDRNGTGWEEDDEG